MIAGVARIVKERCRKHLIGNLKEFYGILDPVRRLEGKRGEFGRPLIQSGDMVGQLWCVWCVPERRHL